MDNERKKISISTNLFDIISTRIKNPQTEFSSVDEYVDYVLKEILLGENYESSEESNEEISEKEAQQVREELKKLGYI